MLRLKQQLGMSVTVPGFPRIENSLGMTEKDNEGEETIDSLTLVGEKRKLPIQHLSCWTAGTPRQK